MLFAALLFVQTLSTVLERYATRGHQPSDEFSPAEDDPNAKPPAAQPPAPPPSTPLRQRPELSNRSSPT